MEENMWEAENVLYELFTGHIDPQNRQIEPHEEYVEANETIDEIREYFFQNFSEEEKQKFWKLHYSYNKVSTLESFNHFCYAVRLTTQFFIEGKKPVNLGKANRDNFEENRLREEIKFD